MTHNAMMIDIETLGLDQGAIILSCGAAICDLEAPNYALQHTDYARFNFEYEQKNNTIDIETMKWWMKQSEEARHVFDEEPVTIARFWSVLRGIAISHNVETFWSKGSDFDLKLLSYYFKENGYSSLWTYKQVRCFRTLEALYPMAELVPDKAAIIKHNALHDAEYQLQHLYNIWQYHIQAKTAYLMLLQEIEIPEAPNVS